MSSWVSLCLVVCLVSSVAGQPNPTSKTTYLVKVTTGNMGLDPEPADGDQVFIKISGEKTVTNFKKLRKGVNAFKNGSEDEFSITARDVGNITAITIKKTATSLPKEDWRLREVVIVDSKGMTYEFPCMCWISKMKGLERTLKPSKVIPPTVASTQAQPTSPSSSSLASTVASESPSLESTATPTNRKSTKGTSESTVVSGATSTEPTASPGAAASLTSTKPSGSTSSPLPSATGSEPTSNTSASPSPTSAASSGLSTKSSSTDGSSTQATSSPTSAISKPSSPGASPSGPVASKPTEPSSTPAASTGQTSAKVTASIGAKLSKPTSKATAPTSEQPSSASSMKPPGNPSKQPSSVVPTSESGSSGSTTASSSISTSGPTSEASTAALGTKPLGLSSKPTAPTSKKPFTPNIAETISPSGSAKPPGAASSAKPSGPSSSEKPSGPVSSAKPSGPSSSAKPSGPVSSAKPSGPASSAKPAGLGISVKPSGPASSAKPSGPASSAKPSGPASSAKPAGLGISVKPSGPASSAKPTGPSSSVKPSAPTSAQPSGPSRATTAKSSSSSPSGASPIPSAAVTSSGNSSSVPTSPTPAQPHAAFINDLLHEMNVMRLLHGVGPLLLEKNMSQVAQTKAAKLIKRETIADETENTYGMTTCKLAGMAPEKDAAKKCVSKWYATVKDLDWPTPKVTPKSSQFAQLIWKATSHVGIGVAGTNVVVYYDPPSNKMESARDNILPVTELSDGTLNVCPEGFRLSGSSCFKFIATPSTWAKAIETCAYHGATLASLQSREENTFINGMMSGLQNSNTIEAWIGFNDRIAESSYQWVDGSVVKFHQFLQTEPTGIGENCVALKNAKNETGWEDRKCTDILPSLCRRPAEGPITFKITFLIEVVNPNPSSKKTVVPSSGDKDHATLIKEKLKSSSNKKPIEFIGESTGAGPDGGSYYSVIVKVPPGTNPNIVQPLQKYLDDHNNRIYPGSKEKVFIVSVSVNNPANGMCFSTCFTTCSNQCSPMCCSGTYIINPSTQTQTPLYQQQTQPRYNYPHGYQYPASSSYSSSYLPSYPSVQQNSPSAINPYMSPNTMGCVRACTRISRNDFCPPYCPKSCCKARFFQPRSFARPRIYSLKK